MRAVLSRAPCPNMPLILCSKGIEEGSGLMLHEVAHAVCPSSPVAVLSGPTFAHEVAAGLPTAVTLACEDEALGEALRDRIALPTFRTYLSSDVAGAEVGGAVKNVLAIACGVVEGRGLGQNARAALIARGFAEMTRFGLAMGAQARDARRAVGAWRPRADLLVGKLAQLLARQGDRRRPQSAAELMADRRTVAEGAYTAPVLHRVANERGIDMPIVAAVDALLKGSAGIDEVLEQMMARPPRPEAH